MLEAIWPPSQVASPPEVGRQVQAPPIWRPDQPRLQREPVSDPADEAASVSKSLFGCTGCCTVSDNDILSWVDVRRLGMDDTVQDGEDCDDVNLEDAESDDCDWKLLGNNSLYSGLGGMHDKQQGQAGIREELKSLAWLTGDLFESEGWDIIQVSGESGDRFKINGRKVRIFLLPEGTPLKDHSHHSRRFGAPTAKKAAHIMVHDGPLKQPLLDYLMQTGKNEHYDARGTENPVAVTGEARKMEFKVPATALDDRIDAMKHATAQASARRRSANDERERWNFLPETPPSSPQHCRSSLSGAVTPLGSGSGYLSSSHISPISRGRSVEPTVLVPGQRAVSQASSREHSRNRRFAGFLDASSIYPQRLERSREPSLAPSVTVSWVADANQA